MRQQVTDEFTQVSVTAGTLQNVSEFRNIEVASTQEKGTGIVLKPLERIQFLEDTTVYVRTFGNNDGVGGRAYFTTEPFKLKVGRGNAKNKVITLTNNFYKMSDVYPNTYQTMTEIPDELDTSQLTTAKEMFKSCKALTSIPNLNTSNVTNMSWMFGNCFALTSIPDLDTSNVTNMNRMFRDCGTLTFIPNLDTSNVTDIIGMFSGCKALTSIPNLDTSNVTDMNNMFDSCSSLTSVPDFDVARVQSIYNMSNMFINCSKLTKVTLLNVSKTIKSEITSQRLKGDNTLEITFA